MDEVPTTSNNANGKRKRDTSECWTFFEVSELQENIAICKLCKSQIRRGTETSGKKNFSTKGLWTHLNAHHPKEKENAEKERAETLKKKRKIAEERNNSQKIYNLTRQVTLEQTKVRQSKWSSSSERQQALENKLVLWICTNTLPYTTVSDSMFLQFIEGLNPKFTVPHEKTLRTNIIPTLYQKVQYKVQNLLEDLCGTFCLTVDIWSSKTLDSYFGVTIEFITKDFLRKIAVLRCMPYNRRHTGDSIREEILFILSSWNLRRDQLHCVLADSAANMRKACRSLNGLRCFLHILNLIIKNSIFVQTSVKNVLKKLLYLIKKMRTPLGKLALNKHQDEDSYRNLVRPVETRWNSYYVMAKSVMDEKTAVTLAQLDPELKMSARKQLTALDWEIIGKLLIVIKPVYKLTMIGQAENICISQVIPFVKRLKHELATIVAPGIRTFQRAVEEKTIKYFDEK